MDLVFLAYVGVISVLLVAGRARLPDWPWYLAVHLTLFAAAAWLRFGRPTGRPWNPRPARPRASARLARRLLELLREAYPLALLPAAYLELGVLNRLETTRYFDDLVLRWDLALFGGHPQSYLYSWLPYPLVSEFLHFCYLFYILLVPILGFTLFFQGRREAFRVFATTVALTMYACYLIFMFFPVRGPWYTFPHPAIPRGFFGSAVDAYLLRGASPGCAFPSSHVAGAVAVAVMARRFSRRLSYALMVLAGGIALATVYGGFHYAIDSLSGLVFGLGLALLGPRVHRALLRQHRLRQILVRESLVRSR